ncbi:MAG: T9SS type A sorting domain-containing protein [Chitinophagaceae bacterium]
MHKLAIGFTALFLALGARVNAQTNFTQGNLVVNVATSTTTSVAAGAGIRFMELNKTTAAQTPIQNLLVDSNTNGLGPTDYFRIQGTGTSAGYLSFSNDRTLLSMAGVNTNINTTPAALNPRVVLTVNSGGTMQFATTYTNTGSNTPRSASSLNNIDWYPNDANGIYTNGASLPLVTANIRAIKPFGGVLYASQALTTTANISTLNGPVPSALTPLPGFGNGLSSFCDFYLISSGQNGASFDILYMTFATSGTAGTIYKYSLVNGTWLSNGTYTTTFGGFGIAAERTCANAANLFVASGNGATSANSLYRLTDNSGYNQPINITTANNVVLYTVTAGNTIKGVAFAPRPVCNAASSALLSVNGFSTICQGNTATLQVDIVGGVSPYTVVYTDGTTCTTVSGYLSGSAIQVTPSANTNYTLLSVTGANGCEAYGVGGSANITVNPASVASVTMNASPTGPVCAGSAITYTATATGTGLTPTYTFYVDNVAVQTGSSNTFTYASPVNNAQVYCTMTSSDNCALPVTSSSSLLVASVNPIPTPAPTTGLSTICSGQSVTLSATGATTLIWQPGNLSGASVNVTPGLGVTTYTITGVNAGGCTATTTTQVLVNASPSLNLSAAPILCNGGTTTLTANTTGGTASFAYMLNNGPIQPGNTFSGLSAGAYTVLVSDANICSATSVLNITEPVALSANSVASPILCFGASSTVNVTASGGTLPYTGTGSFFVPAGAYSYTVTDANGCTAQTAGSITQPTALVASATPGTILCNGGQTSITVSATGGTSPYTGIGTFNNVLAGPYSYTVTDANGCPANAVGSITQPAVLAVSASHPPIQCYGNATNVLVSATGGTSPYTGTGSFPTAAGTYSYTVTDVNGCSGTLTNYSVTEPTQLVVTSTPGTIACGATTVLINVSATGGTPYSFGYIGTGNLPASIGFYGFTVYDSLGCAAFTSGNTIAPNTVLVSANVSSSVNCGGGNVFELTASGTGLNYNWQPGNLNGATQTVVVPGNQTYTVTATSSGLCSATSVVNINLTTPSGNVAQTAPGYTSQSQQHLDGLSLTYSNNLCDVLASIQDAPGGNVLGTTTVDVYVDNSIQQFNGQPYVARHYDITPSNNGPATVTLYFTQADFTAYNAANGNFPDLPTTGSNTDPNIANIRITKVNGVLGVAPATVITPTMNWTGSYWTATFPVSGFSQFFMHSANPGNVPLPVELIGFSGTAQATANALVWETATEINNAYFNVEYSKDGIQFETLSTVKSRAEHGNSVMPLVYNYVHTTANLGHNYYRLKQVDIDGRSSYSKTIDVQRRGAGMNTCTLYPNPSAGAFNIMFNTPVEQVQLMVYDMSGRLVRSYTKTMEQGASSLACNAVDLADGLYTIQVMAGDERFGIFRWEKRQ